MSINSINLPLCMSALSVRTTCLFTLAVMVRSYLLALKQILIYSFTYVLSPRPFLTRHLFILGSFHQLLMTGVVAPWWMSRFGWGVGVYSNKWSELLVCNLTSWVYLWWSITIYENQKRHASGGWLSTRFFLSGCAWHPNKPCFKKAHLPSN